MSKELDKKRCGANVEKVIIDEFVPSKELEKEYLEDLDHYDEGMGIHSTSYEKCKERLIRLAKIDNAKPSEALEWLNKFKGIELSSLPFKSEDGVVKEVDLNEVRYVGSQLNNDFRKFVYIIETALLKAQEQEKVLKIIFEKKVDIALLKKCKTVEEYNFCINFSEDNLIISYEHPLTEEEFELLKRYFKVVKE